MNVTPIDEIKVGQRVAWTVRSGSWHVIGYRGEVTRTTDATVWVKPDSGGGEPKTFRANRHGKVDLHVLTAHELALEGWAKLRPTTEAVTISTDGASASLVDVGAKLSIRLDDRAIRARLDKDGDVLKALGRVRDECERLARWVFERPEPPIEGA